MNHNFQNILDMVPTLYYIIPNYYTDTYKLNNRLTRSEVYRENTWGRDACTTTTNNYWFLMMIHWLHAYVHKYTFMRIRNAFVVNNIIIVHNTNTIKWKKKPLQRQRRQLRSGTSVWKHFLCIMIPWPSRDW